MRVLITGANGFIGRHVVAGLRGIGAEVHAISRDGKAPTGAIGHNGDLLDAQSTASVLAQVQPTHLVHLAWCTKPGEYWTSSENLDWVASSLLLCRRFADIGGTRIVVAGTCAEYDWTYDRMQEFDTPCAPATPYGTAKDALRRLLERFYVERGPSVVWGRIFFLYGPGEKHGRLVSDVVQNLLRGERVDTTIGTQVRDFMHVADVGAAFAALCKCRVTGPVNIASGKSQSVRHIVEMLGEIAGRPDLLNFGALPMRQREAPRIEADVSRLFNEVGFRTKFDLRAGLEDTVAWWARRAQ